MHAFAHASLALRRASGAAASASNSSIRVLASLSDGFYSSPALKLRVSAADSFRRSFLSSSSFSTSTSTSSSSSSSSSVLPLPPSARSDFAYCADLVRKNDPENYLWVAELPKAERAVALALRAFNVETAMAADSASAHSKKEGVPSLSTGGIGRSAGEHQRALASARLLWWKEAAVGAATSGSPSAAPPPDHPVARAIAAVAASGAVSPRSLSARLSRVATARAEDAAPTSSASASAAPFATMRDLENYGENTAAQLLYLQLEAAGVSSSSSSSAAADADHAASHLGRAAAIVSLLRGMKAHASSGSSGGIDGQRRCYLPVSELDAAGTSPRELFAVVDSRARARQKGREGGAMTAASSNNDDNNDPFFFPDSLREATRSVASAALSHLSAARKLRERLDSSSRAKTKCFLQSVGVERYLLLLERCGFDPLTADEVALGTQAARARYRAGLAVRTKWCSWRGTY